MLSLPFQLLWLLTFALPGVLFGLLIWLIVRSRRRVDPSAAARLQSLGFTVEAGPSRPPRAPFPELWQPTGAVNFRISRTGSFSTAFQYQYVTGFGQHKETHRHSCALVPLAFAAPDTTIQIGRIRFGPRRVESDSTAFNDMYDVRCADERFAYTLLDYELIEWLLQPPRLMFGATIRICGSWLMVRRPQEHELQLPELVDLAHAFRDHTPAVLQSLYPQHLPPPPRRPT